MKTRKQLLERARLGGALAYAGSSGRRWPATLPGAPEARAWLTPRALVLFFGTVADARRACALLKDVDPRAKVETRVGRSPVLPNVAATVPWALAAAVVVAMGLPRLVAITQGKRR